MYNKLSDKTEAHLTDQKKNKQKYNTACFITLGKALNLNFIVIHLLKN